MQNLRPAAFDHRKYRAARPVQLSSRTWPDKRIVQAPFWCSVDLRDGNQALINPMSVEQKKQLYALLVKVGFKEIEVGFPAASQPDYEFVRWLIEAQQVPEDVTLQVLTQSRPELIEKTFDALKGAHKAIVHLYNSTSPVQREQVFNLEPEGIIDIAVRGARKVKEMALARPQTQWRFEYSPESFSQTELEFAVEIVNAVIEALEPTVEAPLIVNLPSTVEATTPNIYADQIEWFCRHVKRREAVIVSVHTHNDRGCAVAAAELAVMAGAQRVEGTLLGNGERTGNMDVITMAMNLYSQGVDPCLNLADVSEILRVYKACTDLPVHPRHPYVGELVYTAFSGSHQDAIKKCLARYSPGQAWNVAYLPIDPADLGRSYQEVIRVNSQSGKGGVAYTMEHNFGLQLPRWLQIHFSGVVQRFSEQQGGEVSARQMWDLFQRAYCTGTGEENAGWRLDSFELKRARNDQIHALLSCTQGARDIEGEGQGAVDAFVQALKTGFGIHLDVLDYSEHALSAGSGAKAVTFVQVNVQGALYYAAAIHEDIVSASLNAVLGAVNQSCAAGVAAA